MRLLSEDIRLGGIMGVEETIFSFMREDLCGCALGTAGFARGWTRDDFLTETIRLKNLRVGPKRAVLSFQALYPQYPGSALLEVNERHTLGEPRLSIADWLEREVEPALGLRPKAEEAEVVA